MLFRQRLLLQILVAWISSENCVAQARDLKGTVETGAIRPSASMRVLQGGIKSDESLKSSLKVYPGAANNARGNLRAEQAGEPVSLDAGIQQYAGSAQYEPGKGAPRLDRPQPYGSRRSGIIPPIHSYTMSPRASTIWVAPGYEVTPSNSSEDSLQYLQIHHETVPIPKSGITTYVPGYETTTSKTYEDPPPVRHGGMVSWVPGYDVTVTTNSLMPPIAVHCDVPSFKGVTSWERGYEVTISSSSPGQITYKPGHEVSIVVPGLVKNSLGGVWTASSVPALKATPKLLPTSEFAEVVVGPPPPMVASAKLLPGLRPSSESLNWQDFYARVAEDIYCRWQNAEVGPGLAKVSITVTKDRNMSCKPPEFEPYPGTTVSPESEIAFRQASVDAIHAVTKFEIPYFPSGSTCNAVTFEVELKRSVNGSSGFEVARKN